MEVTITIPQGKALQKLDPALTPRQVLQAHVDTWLAPYVAELDTTDRREVAQAYEAATPATQQQVKGLLGLA